MIYVNRIPQNGNPVMEGIFISDARPEKRQPPGEPITIVAERGWLIADPASDRVVFRLENGGIHVALPRLHDLPADALPRRTTCS